MNHTRVSLMLLLLSSVLSAPLFAADLVTGGYSRAFQQMGMMKMIDADGNHMVSATEFNQYYTQLFDTLDKNKNGTLDTNEWVGTKNEPMITLATGGYIQALRDMKMMEKIDANKDHAVTKDEFLNYQGNVFSTLDTSKDKQIDAQEFVANILSKS